MANTYLLGATDVEAIQSSFPESYNMNKAKDLWELRKSCISGCLPNIFVYKFWLHATNCVIAK